MKKLLFWRYMRKIGLLSAVALTTNLLPVHAAWDGFPEQEKTNDTQHVILNTDNMGILLNTGGIPSTKQRMSSRYSLLWDHGSSKGIQMKQDIPRDWSEYNRMEFAVYSEKATGGQFAIIVHCDPQTANGESYFKTKAIAVDWEGWRNFSFKLEEDFEIARGAVWNKITYVSANTGEWNMKQLAGTRLYFDKIVLKTASGGSTTADYTEEFQAAYQNAVADAAIVYEENPKTLYHGELKALCEADTTKASIERNGAPFVPVSYFADYLGCTTEKISQFSPSAGESERTGTGVKITFDGKEIQAMAGEKQYIVNGETKEFTQPPESVNETLYLPLGETAAALGKCVVQKNKLTAVSDSESVYALANSRRMSDFAAYMIHYTEFDISTVTDEDLKQLRQNWRQNLIGTEDNDLTNPYIKEVVDTAGANGKKSLEMMNDEDSDLFALFGEEEIAETLDMSNQYKLLWYIARAYALKGTELYKNPKVLEKIIYGFDWLYDHVYGENVRSGAGWKKGGGFNWYDWEVTTPQYIVDSLLLLEEDLPADKIEKWLIPVDIKCDRVKNTGSNRMLIIYNIIGAALLHNDAERIVKARDGMASAMEYVDEGEGHYEDGSYIFHIRHAMNGSYGIAELTPLVPILQILNNTKFAVTDPRMDHFAEWIYECYEPFMYKGGISSAVRGRGVGWEHQGGGGHVIRAMISLADTMPAEDCARMKSLVKHHVQEDETMDYYSQKNYKPLNIDQINKLQAIMADDTIKPREDYAINKVYYNEDRMVHQRDGYAFVLAMSSSRIYNYESINSEGMTNWYTGDGMLYFYNDPWQYDGYRTASFWSGDRYHMPGVTADTQERQAVSIFGGREYLSSKDFVGGVSNGVYGAAAMELESYHGPGSEDQSVSSYGGPAPAHDCSLEAKKSWFMFDDELVALGADIHANDGFDVQTTIEQRWLREKQKIEGAVTAIPYSVVKVSASAVPEEENVPENTIDDSLDTRWSADGDAWIAFDLGENKPLGYAGIAFFNSNVRETKFDLEVSEDGKTWEKVYSGTSVKGKAGIQGYSLKNKTARYVRIYGHGNTVNEWNSVLECKIYAPTEDGSMLLDDGAGYIQGTEDVTVDGQLLEKVAAYEKSFENPSWIHLQNDAGFYLPEGGKVTMKKVNAETNYLTFWFEHGVSPKNQKYAYVVLPNKTAEQTAEYSKNPDIEILSNTALLQAVREKKLGITQMVFWGNGKCENISVSAPCMVMAQATEGGMEISVSDPTQKLTELTVTVNQKMALESADSGIGVTKGDSGVTLKIDCAGSRGKTFTAKLLNQ